MHVSDVDLWPAHVQLIMHRLMISCFTCICGVLAIQCVLEVL